MGNINPDGAHEIDLLGENVGSHYNVNLLLGNRIGYPSPLISTPKSAVDSLGHGSFRADAGRQVLATRYDFRFEDNGEPTNRQFYLYENGKQIFFSANVKENVKRGVCRHMPNRTVIEYETNCGLKITRTIFIMPQDDNMPEAVEAQRVEIENTSNKKRSIKAVFTGNFGISSIESLSNDLVYASVIHEGGVIRENGKVIAVAPSSHPGYMRWQKRFAEIFESGEPMDEFCTTYNDFFGSGTIEHPEFGAHLASNLASKCVSFFAMAKSVVIEPGCKKTFDSFVGYTGDKTPDLSVFKEKLSNFTSKYRNAENTAAAYKKVCGFAEEYSSYVKLSSEDALFDSYVNNNLPFQVLYQSFVSRSFAWAQKAYREIGFREIQDIYASLYYMCAMGNSALAKELISRWARNVYKMGYANHNFYETGKEPGMCSDDGLWLVQAVYRYVSLTGDYGFLDEEFDMADGGTRKLIDTMDAVVTYSGKISVGEHGFPLMDKADWNDTMKLDNDWINGEKKQELYFAQLEKTGEKYGAKFESDYS
ncbi:MAG: glycosyl transferase, partial [Clostridiales bacterium]|nr:glycosyl transferase [Clostridiales bacterium]